jgi:hypothetical protein
MLRVFKLPGPWSNKPVSSYFKLYLMLVTSISNVFSVHQNYGPWFDVQGAGIHSVFLVDLHKSKKDLSSGKWTYQVKIHLIYQLDLERFCPI